MMRNILIVLATLFIGACGTSTTPETIIIVVTATSPPATETPIPKATMLPTITSTDLPRAILNWSNADQTVAYLNEKGFDLQWKLEEGVWYAHESGNGYELYITAKPSKSSPIIVVGFDLDFLLEGREGRDALDKITDYLVATVDYDFTIAFLEDIVANLDPDSLIFDFGSYEEEEYTALWNYSKMDDILTVMIVEND